MRHWVAWLAAAGALVFAGVGFRGEPERPGRERGKAAAEINVRSGKLTILAYGLRSKSSRLYDLRLQDRYGIEVKPIAGCVVSEDLMDFAMAFNDVTIEATRKKFGRDVVAETVRELSGPAR